MFVELGSENHYVKPLCESVEFSFLKLSLKTPNDLQCTGSLFVYMCASAALSTTTPMSITFMRLLSYDL